MSDYLVTDLTGYFLDGQRTLCVTADEQAENRMIVPVLFLSDRATLSLHGSFTSCATAGGCLRSRPANLVEQINLHRAADVKSLDNVPTSSTRRQRLNER